MDEEEELLLKTEAYHVVENYGFYAKCLEKKSKFYLLDSRLPLASKEFFC